jgi:hypothetical protein
VPPLATSFWKRWAPPCSFFFFAMLTYHRRLCPASVVDFSLPNQSRRNTRKEKSRTRSKCFSQCPSYVPFVTLEPGLVSRRRPLMSFSSSSVILPSIRAVLHSLYVLALLYRISTKALGDRPPKSAFASLWQASSPVLSSCLSHPSSSRATTLNACTTGVWAFGPIAFSHCHFSILWLESVFRQ